MTNLYICSGCNTLATVRLLNGSILVEQCKCVSEEESSRNA